ncbi:MAG: NAD+ synthase [Candidatus Sumerlaeota bacterium]
MRIALAQINTTVGAIARNANQVVETLRHAGEHGADLVVFPELTITGYPPLDLLDRPSFVTHNIQALKRVACEAADLPAAIVGFVHRDHSREGTGLFNAAALISGGEIVNIRAKSLLPTYDVFDEMRYFDAAYENPIVEFQGLRIGLSICEDIWNDALFWGRFSRQRRYAHDPIEEHAKAGCDLMINIAASPFTEGKRRIKQRMFSSAARRHKTPLVCVNLVGGNDSLIFDGGSNVFNSQGDVILQARDFDETLVYWDFVNEADLEKTDTFESTCGSDLEAILEALTLGVRDYFRKTGFSSTVIGLSGGIDSALTAAVAVRALGSENVYGVGMPSDFSSSHSVDDARQLAENLEIDFTLIPIKDGYESQLKMLDPLFRGLPFGVAEENLQARIRGNILMAISNKFGRLLLSTGNKSELAVGYCTLYGDMSGGLAVLSDVPKTMVYELSRLINNDREIIPHNTIEKPPSAELRPDQKDSDSLPDYEMLDPIIRAYVEEGLYVDEIVEEGYDRETVERVIRMIERAEYKRRQAAIGLKVTHRAFGYGRRMPVARGRDLED